MNTNELRKLANRAIQECMYSGFYAAANPAAVIGLLDEIDRLTREAVAADIRIANDALVIAGLTAERDAMPCVVLTPEDRAAFERFHETWEDNEGYDGPKEMMRRLAEVGVVHHITAGRYDITKFGHYVLAAGAAPVPNGHRLVSVEALTKWRNAFAEELSAWDIDPPLHHMQTSHDDISAILVAAPKVPT